MGGGGGEERGGEAYLAEGQVNSAISIGSGQSLAATCACSGLDHCLRREGVLCALSRGAASTTTGAPQATKQTSKKLTSLIRSLTRSLGPSRRPRWGSTEVILLPHARSSTVRLDCRRVRLAHKDIDHIGSDHVTAALGLAEGAAAGLNVTVADDGGVGLRAAAVGGAVTGCAVCDGETGHFDAVGASDFGYYTVGGGGAGQVGDSCC